MSKENPILATEVNIIAVDELKDRINHNSKLINDNVNSLVANYCKQLDEYVKYINQIIQDQEHPVTAQELDDFVIQLPILLYFAGEAQENLGIKTDVAKAIKQEKYNEVYNQVKGTIADKTAKSELEAQAEAITHIIYDRAYKIVKEKMTAAYELLSSCKKVISRRMAELQLANLDEGRILNGSKR